MPIIKIDSVDYVALTPQLAGIQRKALGKPIATIEYARADVMNALDFLFTGI